MDARGNEHCLSCEELTKYKCLICNLPTCNRCCLPEADEDVDGWCMGLSVGYCNNCNLNIQRKAKDTVMVASSSSNTTPNYHNLSSSSQEKRYVNTFYFVVDKCVITRSILLFYRAFIFASM